MKAIAPISRVVETSQIPEASNNPTAQLMISQLLADNKQLCEMLAKISEESEKQKSYATANLVQDLMESHGKFVWMLRSFLKE
jgi:DNA-binding ferritin-like protein